ncbi:MAG: glutaredoxin domain-containing protein [Candidatus Humimicrobiaceae bacterium]
MEKVIVYSTSTCPYCNRVKDYLASKGVKFKNIDIAKDKKYLDEMVKKSGQMGIPVIDIGGNIIIGFEKEEIDKAVEEV